MFWPVAPSNTESVQEPPMRAKTYDDWGLLGYHVRKGEKATGRDKAGKATFTRDQVVAPEEEERQPPGPGYEGWHDNH